MSNAPEFGQGEGTLSRAAGLVTDARCGLQQDRTEAERPDRRRPGQVGRPGRGRVLHPAHRLEREAEGHRRRPRRVLRVAPLDREGQRQHRRRAERVLHQAQRPPRLTRTTGQGDRLMNLDGIRVNHAALDQAAQDMYQTVKDIDDRMNRLESELAPLKSDWHGNAQQRLHHGEGQVGLGHPGDARPARREPQDRSTSRTPSTRPPTSAAPLSSRSEHPHTATTEGTDASASVPSPIPRPAGSRMLRGTMQAVDDGQSSHRHLGGKR